MSRRTRRSSPRRSCHFSQGVPPIPRSCEPVSDRQFALRALFGATPWPRHARSRRLPPSPPCRPDACEAMQSNCVAPTRSLGRSSALLQSECMHPPCPWQHRYRRQPDRFVSSSTPFLAWYGLEALATVRVEEDTGAVPCSVTGSVAFGRNGLSSGNGRLVRTARCHILADFLDTRAQGRPGARCTRGLVCNMCKECAHEHTGSAETLRPSLRNGFTAYIVLSPVTGFLATVAPQITPQD